MTRREFTTALALTPFGIPSSTLNWRVLNLAGEVRETNWVDAQKPFSLGSLLKPFLALAYLSTHAQAPVIECRGAAAGCWHAQGHGRQDMIAALANSCNVYFLEVAANIERAALDLTCLSYGLSIPAREMSATRLIGLDEGWPQSRIATARAFAALAGNSRDLHVQTVLAGMARCARAGTGSAVKLTCFAKTGTAHCGHLKSGRGDGYAVAMYPLDQPRCVVLAMQHNKTGAETAGCLGPLIKSYAPGEG
jgi:cell division protein FtsI/penicillin-binding protein 2